MAESEAEQLILLNLDRSGFVARVRIALAEKGLKYETKEEDISNKSPLLLQMNPINKKVPVLIHNGKPICESMIIVQYIDEVWNHKSPLLPSDPYQRANARFWAEYIDNKIFPLVRIVFFGSKGEEKETPRKEFLECLKILEGELGDKPYFGGESFGYVDLVFIPFGSSFYSFDYLGNYRMEEECPKLLEWCKRCLQRETVSNSLNLKAVDEVVLAMRKKLELEEE